MKNKVPLMLMPGILMPAALRYAPLIDALGADVDARPTDLAVYAGSEPPPAYSIASEVESLLLAADAAGFERFHLYGHSGGGAVSLAFAVQHPDRLLTLAVDRKSVV